MKPKAIRNLAMVRSSDGLLRLEIVEAGRQVVLDPLAEVVWELSDGSRSLEDIAQAASRYFDRAVHKEEVFSALDFLADAGLIEERVAPPVAESNVSRRSLLVKMAPVVGAAAWMMSGASARAGGLFQYNESNSKESNTKESNTKENNSKSNQRQDNNREYDNKEIGWKRDQRNDTDAINKEREVKNRPGNDKKSAGESTNREHSNKERDRVWYDQRKGRIDHTGKYAVTPNHSLVGKWKAVADYGKILVLRDSCDETCIKAALIWTISSSGILESQVSSISYNSKEQSNWKYTATGPRSGVLEAFLGDLVERGDIRWIRGKNEFEYTVTFSSSPGSTIGERTRYARDY